LIEKVAFISYSSRIYYVFNKLWF